MDLATQVAQQEDKQEERVHPSGGVWRYLPGYPQGSATGQRLLPSAGQSGIPVNSRRKQHRSLYCCLVTVSQLDYKKAHTFARGSLLHALSLNVFSMCAFATLCKRPSCHFLLLSNGKVEVGAYLALFLSTLVHFHRPKQSCAGRTQPCRWIASPQKEENDNCVAWRSRNCRIQLLRL